MIGLHTALLSELQYMVRDFILTLDGLSLAVTREQYEIIFPALVLPEVERSAQKPDIPFLADQDEVREMRGVEVR